MVNAEVVYITYFPQGSKFAAIKVCTHEEVSKIVDYSFSRPSSDEIFEISSKGYKKFIQNGFYIKTISKCPIGKKTNLLHRIVNESLEKEEKIDKFIKDR